MPRGALTSAERGVHAQPAAPEVCEEQAGPQPVRHGLQPRHGGRHAHDLVGPGRGCGGMLVLWSRPGPERGSNAGLARVSVRRGPPGGAQTQARCNKLRAPHASRRARMVAACRWIERATAHLGRAAARHELGQEHLQGDPPGGGGGGAPHRAWARRAEVAGARRPGCGARRPSCRMVGFEAHADQARTFEPRAGRGAARDPRRAQAGAAHV
jgi:hypothetical protein